MTTSGKRSALTVVGVVLLIVGLLAAVGLWYSANQRETDAVRNLARAPSGCDTTLVFDATGEFTIYFETAGRFVDSIAGDCVADGAYGVLGDELPAISLSMTAPGGDDVELATTSGETYDADGFVGRSIRTFRVDEPGDYVLRVEAPAAANTVTLAVAVGRDPSEGVDAMQWGAMAAAVGALLLGGGAIVASRRRATPEPAAVTDPTWSAGPAGWPTTPPGMPVAAPLDRWQQAPGPPNQPPATPAQPPESWPGAMPAAPATAPPNAPPNVPPSAAPTAPPSAGAVPPAWTAAPTTTNATTGAGTTGDGERSPWAPPSDAPQG